MHVGGWVQESRSEGAGGRRWRNVCDADCGNVISRYVAVGRLPRGSATYRPATSLSFAPRWGRTRVVVVNVPRAKVSRRGRTTGISRSRTGFLFPLSLSAFSSPAVAYRSRKCLFRLRSAVRKWIPSENSRPVWRWYSSILTIMTIEIRVTFTLSFRKNLPLSATSKFTAARYRKTSRTIGHERSIPLFMFRVVLYIRKTLRRIAESFLEFANKISWRKITGAHGCRSFTSGASFKGVANDTPSSSLPLLPLSLCHFFFSRASFIGPGARDSFTRRVFESIRAHSTEQLPSVGPERTKGSGLYIFHGRFFVSRIKWRVRAWHLRCLCGPPGSGDA